MAAAPPPIPVSTCPECGYDLTGQLAASRERDFRCSECGVALRWQAARRRSAFTEIPIESEAAAETRRSLRKFETGLIIFIFAVVLLTPLIMWIIQITL